MNSRAINTLQRFKNISAHKQPIASTCSFPLIAQRFTLNPRQYSTDEKANAPLLEKQVSPIFWVDVETTGLDPATSKILELAMVITDSNLDIIDEGLNIVFHQPPSVIEEMDDWCTKTHTKNGLIDEVKASKLTIEQGEVLALNLVKKYSPKPKKAVIAGSSVQFDQIFLKNYMPKLADYMHFRIIDVSTINELGKRWAPKFTALKGFKWSAHRAKPDILESIDELKYYKKTLFGHVLI